MDEVTQNNFNLKKKTIKSITYSFGGFVSKSGIELILGIVLARLLLPEDYGILGMIMVFIVISDQFIDSGMTNALIREKSVSTDDYSTVFYYNLAIAIVVYTILFFSANLVSRFYNEPSLVKILRISGLAIIIGSFGLIQKVILVRDVNFKVQSIILIIASLVSGIVAIYFAYIGYGVWSLIIKLILFRLLTSLLYIVHNWWIPVISFNVESFKKFFSFGYKLLLTGILATIYQNLYNVIIGKFYQKNQLGYYTKSKQFSDLAALSMATSVTDVSYPVLSQLQENPKLLKAGFEKVIKYTTFLTFPIMVGLAVIAEPFITILLGDKWVPMVPYFQILSISAITLPHRSINLNILKVKGRSDLFLKLDVIKIIIGLVSILFVVLLDLGIPGLLATVFINSKIAFFVNASYSKKLTGYSLLNQIKDMGKPLFATMLMASSTYLIGLELPYNMYINVIIQISYGVFVYLLLSYILKIEELKSIYALVKAMILKK
jgi:O-antigen/teichoic acid export membrane protein